MANEWANWAAAHEIIYSAASDETIATMSQKIIAEYARIYGLLARLRQHDAGTGTALTDSVPYQFKVDTLTQELLVRNSDNSAWVTLGKLAANFGITAAAITALATKGGATSLACGNDADKPLASNSATGDIYLSVDKKKMYRMGATDWELVLSLNITEMLGYDKLIIGDNVSQTASPGKIPRANSAGELEYSITGSAAKIGGKSIDTTNIADGRILVYRDSTGGFVFETKGGGTGGGADIDDANVSTGTTYSSNKIVGLLGGKADTTGTLTAFNCTYDGAGDYKTVAVGGKVYSIARDAYGRLDTVSDGVSTLKANYNAAGQFIGMGVV